MKFIYLFLLIVSCNTYSQSNFSSIIGNPIEVSNLLVAEFDFPQELTYSEAKQNFTMNGLTTVSRIEEKMLGRENLI